MRGDRRRPHTKRLRLSAIEPLGYQGDRALVHLHLDALSDWPDVLRLPTLTMLAVTVGKRAWADHVTRRLRDPQRLGDDVAREAASFALGQCSRVTP